MDDMHDAWFFIGIFVFIFIIWVATGGPNHPLAFTGPSLSVPRPLGTGTYLSFPRSPFGIGGTNISLPGSSNGGGAIGGGESVPSLVGGMTFGEASPYRGIVSLNHYVSSAGAADPRNEYLELSISQNASVPVDITGWTLQSDATGNAITIPRGTEVPTSGTVNAVQNIVLTAGTRAMLISGQSPIGGSFRENKCIGYFSSFQKFSPSLPQNCPTPSDELVSNYGAGYIRDATCIDYVNKLSRCQVALTPPVTLSGTCQSFLVKYLNYNGCVEAHQKDADFAGNTWRVHLGRSNSMWRTQHEIVKLLDRDGKTVDAFSY
ncbi:MAG: hypothetical protein WAV50_03990 [Minisyncoccia bacterium]